MKRNISFRQKIENLGDSRTKSPTRHKPESLTTSGGMYKILQWFGRISIAVILCAIQVPAQQGQQPPDEFLIGAFIHSMHPPYMWYTQRTNYDQILECGLNSVFQIAIKDLGDPQTPNLEVLSQFPFVYAANDSGTGSDINICDWCNAVREENIDWISYFTQAKYRKWEAEGSDLFQNYVKIKHEGGKPYQDQDETKGWKTNDNQPGELIIYGPNYWQWPRYSFTNAGWNPTPINYKAVFRMKIDSPSTESLPVCEIFVSQDRYNEATKTWEFDKVLSEVKTVMTNELDTMYVNISLEYNYIGEFDLPSGDPSFPPPPTLISDPFGEMPNPPTMNEGSQVQFIVKWLGNRELFIDYIEVYDIDIWEGFFKNNYPLLLNRISTYDESFKNANINFYNKLKYYGTIDEPHVIDCYEPLRKIQFILDSLNINADLLVHWYPGWDGVRQWDGWDATWPVYKELAQPKKIMFWYAPFVNDPKNNYLPKPRDFTLYWLQHNLQQAHLQQSDFYVTLQTWGFKDLISGNYLGYMHPTPEEIAAETMLSLAHGVNGIFYETYYSFYYEIDPITQDPLKLSEALVEVPVGYPPVFNTMPQWEKVRYLAARLRGTLGKSLMNLDYSDYYLMLRRNVHQSQDTGNFTGNWLGLNSYYVGETPPSQNFHAGILENPYQTDNNYFLLSNLITSDNRWVNIEVTDDGSNFNNTRFRNIESEYSFDTTFTDEFSIDMEFPAGEGYLYQVAPVIIYGGKLIFNETISSEKTLVDDLIIKNGKTLTINATYNADRSITITEGGRLVTTLGGMVKFYNDQNLIIDGTATISGTPQHKLVLDFLNPAQRNGIIIKPGGSLTIVNCEIRNAGTGIFSELNANYLSAQNVDFINCADYSINIAGRSAGMNPTPPPQITGCTMLNSNYGIAISNLPGMLIFDNDITNTACGIYLSNVVDAQLIGNTIISNREELEGIILLSSGGTIRANLITGHTVGLQLANSSPILGSNVINANKYHGLYIGDGSLPYMRMGSFIGNPPNFYATSGYNKIFQNGGYEGEGDDNDGSEIYFVNSNAAMDKGCNSIYDDREPSPPLVNTELLMNCPEWSPIEVDAQINYWGNQVYERRFGWLRVNYIPYSETPCPEPQDGSAGELVRMTSFGDVIDTVFAIDIEIPDLSETEEAYAEAEEYFLTGNLTNALQIYEGIISSTASEEEKYPAYQRKYSIGKLTGQSVEYFNQLSNTFATLSSNTQDTLNKKILNQLSTLSKVGEQEYETAIAEFDNIVQQNPNTEEAVYAEIDALTTALLLEESDSTFQKGRLGKYLIKSSADYNQRIDEILRKHFGSESKENQKELIPTEYTLYQNYPNPFNPVTTIKYDLPNTSDVLLIIYDILGRKVKELVNTKQQVGRYEIQFDATNLASGVYIYQLTAEKFISSKKMILLK